VYVITSKSNLPSEQADQET
jgi:hypothetical protein